MLRKTILLRSCTSNAFAYLSFQGPAITWSHMSIIVNAIQTLDLEALAPYARFIAEHPLTPLPEVGMSVMALLCDCASGSNGIPILRFLAMECGIDMSEPVCIVEGRLAAFKNTSKEFNGIPKTRYANE